MTFSCTNMNYKSKENRQVKTWERIEAWLEANAPEMIHTLQRGAGDADIKKLESVINIKLPSDFINFYKVHNGQIPASKALINGDQLLSIEEILTKWKIHKEILEREGQFWDETSSQGEKETVKDMWWNPLWIPITDDGWGDGFYMDLDPAETGSYGQIIRFYHDDPQRIVVANSFTEWVEKYVNDLEKDKYIYDKDFHGIIKKDF